MGKPFKPGDDERRRRGRPKGVPNKHTTAVKQVIIDAFDKLGGVDALVEWARKPRNLGLFYSKIWIRVLPLEVKADHSGRVTLEQLVAGAAAESESKDADHA